MRLGILAAWLASALAANAAIVDVTRYGAKGDYHTLNTTALQAAIDACAAAGGGEVLLPKGTFLTGSLVLKSGVHLVVGWGAELLGSTNLADYPNRKLLSADDASDIGIEGGGTIDGQGEAFWQKGQPYAGPAWRGTPQFGYKALARPSFIHFTGCTNVTVKDIRLIGSPSWTLHLQRCIGARIDRATIRNPLYGPNTDGIDLNSCQYVTVDQCAIITGDDGVVLKSTEPGHDHPSRNITVSNCRVWSACNAFKIGTETHDSFEHIVFRDSRLCCDSANPQDRPLAGLAIESVDGSNLSDIQAYNLTMSRVRAPIFVRLGHRGGNSAKTQQVEPRPPGTIRNAVIRDITAEHASFESSITGIPGHDVQDLTLSNLSLGYEGGGSADWVTARVPDEAVVTRYPEAQMFGRLPAYGLYCRHVDGLHVDGIAASCETPDARPFLVCDDVKRARFEGLRPAATTGEFPVVWTLACRDLAIVQSVAPRGTGTFVGADGGGVTLAANDTGAARTALAELQPGELVSSRLPLVAEKTPGVTVARAPDLRLTAPMALHDEPRALGGKAAWAPLGSARDLGQAGFRFTVSEPGDYVVWVHGMATNPESDSFYATIDNGSTAISDFRPAKGAWAWDAVRERDKPTAQTVYALAKGVHTLLIGNRESGFALDAVVIARRDLQVDPSAVAR